MIDKGAKLRKYLAPIRIIKEYAWCQGRKTAEDMAQRARIAGRNDDGLGSLYEADAIDGGIEQRQKVSGDERSLGHDLDQPTLCRESPRRGSPR